jgi:hypothetical protein
VVQGRNLQPGVYYISLALYSTGLPATGTLTATVSSAGRAETELELMPVSDMTLHAKPGIDVRQALADSKAALAEDGLLVKHSPVLKKRERMKSEVGQ